MNNKINEFKYHFKNNPNTIENNASLSKSFAISSMVLGICSVVFGCCLFYIAIPCGIVGLVLGYKSITEQRGGWGMAKAGVITSIIGLSFATFYVLFLIFSLIFNFSSLGFLP